MPKSACKIAGKRPGEGAGAERVSGDPVETARGGTKAKGKGHPKGEVKGKGPSREGGKCRQGHRFLKVSHPIIPGLPAAFKGGHIFRDVNACMNLCVSVRS